MAEFLIRMTNNHGDPLRDTIEGQQARPKRGDIVQVRVNNFDWGRREDKRKWVAEGNAPEDFPAEYGIVRVNGLSITDARKLMRRNLSRPAVQGDREFEEEDPSSRFVRQHKYGWRIRISQMAIPKRMDLNQGRYVELGAVAFRNLCEHKKQRRYFDETDADGLGALWPDSDDPLPLEQP